jgi:nitrogen fixation protein FixH
MADTNIRKRVRWIPWYIVGFFVVVAILDGIFVYVATSTHTGVITRESYERGLAYNETVEAAEKSAALGWKSTLDLVAGSDLMFVLNDKAGAPLSGATVTARMVRPTQDGHDFELPLEETAAGEYRAPVTFPLDGLWDVRIFVEWKQHQYQHSDRLIIRH